MSLVQFFCGGLFQLLVQLLTNVPVLVTNNASQMFWGLITQCAWMGMCALGSIAIRGLVLVTLGYNVVLGLLGQRFLDFPSNPSIQVIGKHDVLVQSIGWGWDMGGSCLVTHIHLMWTEVAAVGHVPLMGMAWNQLL